MITATLTRFENVRGQWRITILYIDTVSGLEIERSYRRESVTKKQLRDLARSETTTIDTSATNDVDIPIGTTIDVTPDPVTPPPDPTPEEIAKSAWFADYEQLKKMLEVTANIPGLETAQATTLINNLKTSLEANWLNSYLGDI